nr:uncharacterized protein I206_01831 [Kwoniella pini CBS 10737]OCF52540.1 hypothetical protein I206_01831 [Kwoniella pini CBS 10737]
MDEEAKKKWQRSKPPGVVVGLPGYLVGGEWVGTMEEFEDAVETQTLETFLKQDIDLSNYNTNTNTNSSLSINNKDDNKDGNDNGKKQKSIQEVELENLMREMTNEDLDKLINDLNVNSENSEKEKEQIGKIGLLNEKNKLPISDIKENDQIILNDLKKELNLDKNEDDFLKKIENNNNNNELNSSFTSSIDHDNSKNEIDKEIESNKKDNVEINKGQGTNDLEFIPESNILKELKDELKLDKNEDKDINEIKGKEKVD